MSHYDENEKFNVTKYDIYKRLIFLAHEVEEMKNAFDPAELKNSLGKLEKKFDDICFTLNDNTKRLNNMINELKGCVAMSRGALKDTKNSQEEK